MAVQHTPPVLHSADGGDRSDFRLIFGASYLLFLLVAVGRRLLPVHRAEAAAGRRRRRSVFAEAKAAAATYLPFAFMG